MDNQNNKTDNNSIIQLYKTRSVVAFYACVVDLFLSVISIMYDLVWYTKAGNEFETFHYYTVDSNCFNALVACMIIPFAIEGVKKKRFAYPRWLAILHYSSTFCITITMVFATFIISWYDFELAFGSINSVFLHLICPCLLLTTFFLSECGYKYTKKETLISMIPFLAYTILYVVNVAILKRWEDIYHFTTYLPWPISLVLMLIFAGIVGFVLLNCYNKYSERRKKKLTESWSDDISSEQINNEIYDLGSLNSSAVDPSMISMNLDILKKIAERFDLDLEELSKSYSKGAIEAIKDRKEE